MFLTFLGVAPEGSLEDEWLADCVGNEASRRDTYLSNLVAFGLLSEWSGSAGIVIDDVQRMQTKTARDARRGDQSGCEELRTRRDERWWANCEGQIIGGEGK